MKQSIYIEAPVETVFDHFMDPRKDIDLMPIDTEVLEFKLTEEGIGTYTSYRSKIAGIPFEMFDVVTDMVRNKRITSKSSSAMEGTWTYTFEPEGTGTRLTLEHQAGSLWRLPLLRNVMDMTTSRMTASYLPKAKARIEAEARKPKVVPGQRKPAASKARKPATRS
ncbi:MAG TPA: SRPBCC family protein [Nocardioidaceae bacterium]